MIDPQSLSRCEYGATLPVLATYYVEIVADDWNNQPRRCGIWVSHISTSKTPTKTLMGIFRIYWSRITYLMQGQHGFPLALAPRISLLTRSAQMLANLGLLTFRPEKSANHRLISPLRSPRLR